jgi:toxin ParE1/3/4
VTPRRAAKSVPKRRASADVARRIVWTNRALADLEAIGDHIARDDAGAAERWVMSLVLAAQRAAATPLAGRRVPEVGRDDIREVLRRSCRIVYRVTREQLEVLTVFEGHRRFDKDAVPRVK